MDRVPIAPRRQRRAELKKMAANQNSRKRTETFDRPPNPDVSSPNSKRKPSTPKNDRHRPDSEEDNLMTPPHARSPHQITTNPVVIVPSATPAPIQPVSNHLVNLGRFETPPPPTPKRNRVDPTLPDPSILVIDSNRAKHFINDPIIDPSPPFNSNQHNSKSKKKNNNNPAAEISDEVILNKEAVYPSDDVEFCISSMYSEVFKHFKGRLAVNEEEINDRAKILRKLHFIGRKGLEKRSSPSIVPALDMNDSEGSSTGSSSKGKDRA